MDNWNIRIDAQTGAFLKKDNWTRKCAFPNHQHTESCGFLEKTGANFPTTPAAPTNTTGSSIDGASYNVFAIPVESPFHGDRTVVSEPADPVASPFGWHDTDGVEGPEFTITRGNNVRAYADVTGRDLSLIHI